MNTINRFWIRHKYNAREYLRTIAYVFFFVLVAWGIAEFGMWIGRVIAERDSLRIEQQFRKTVWEDERWKDAERKAYIAKILHDDPDAARIMAVKWKAR